ncbi:MAG: hypothetical protein IGS48_01110 [Oscillatoriales cyanobacterium C42_A2020_001]|nr:hypothetical protein [Leptolyngbyaceae cyanobacterium C42_A2020_001]
MTADSTAKSNGRASKTTGSRSRTSRATKVEASEALPNGSVQEVATDDAMANSEEVIGEDAMSTDNVVQITTRPAQVDETQKQATLELSQPSLMVWNRPVMPSDIEVAETISVAGVRPIAASHLVLAGSFLNGRPIEASRLTVREMLPGDRPIFDSEFKMVEGMLLPGNRPIMASDPGLLAASVLPGNRPIASNETVDPEPAVLMGYLD